MAEKKGSKYAVMLYDESAKFFSQKLPVLLKDQKYFLCNEVETTGNYVFMKISESNNKLRDNWELSISHNHIAFILKIEGKKDIGFLTN